MLAACLDEDPELFFPTGTTLSAKMQAAVAREVCTQCIVRDETTREPADLRARAQQGRKPRLDRFRTLGAVTDDDQRFLQDGALLLHATGVGDEQASIPGEAEKGSVVDRGAARSLESPTSPAAKPCSTEWA